MRTRRLVTIAALIAGGMLLSPRAAHAQTDANKTQARELGEQAFAALQQSDWAKAEDLFRRADDLYHAPTLTLGLARAQAKEGKVVEAWENYRRILVDGAPAGANAVIKKAVADAETEIRAVEGRRAHVTLTLAGAVKPQVGQHLKVTLDGVEVPEAALGAERVVNPGTHAVHVTADGFRPADASFTVAEGASTSASVDVVAEPTAPTSPTEPGPESAHGSPLKTVGIVGLGVGGAGIVAGVLTGVIAIGKHGDLKTNPCATTGCSAIALADYLSQVSSYNSLGTVSTIAFIAGGVLAAGGAVLFLTAPSHQASAARAWVSPYVGLGSAGMIGKF